MIDWKVTSWSGADSGADTIEVSLDADRLRVDGGLFAGLWEGHRFHPAGAVRLLGGHIVGQLVLIGAGLGANPTRGKPLW